VNDRVEATEELVLYADMLAKLIATDTLAKAFDTVFEEIQDSDYNVTLHEFVAIMQRTTLTETAQERLPRVIQLSELTYPHVPESVSFGALWTVVSDPTMLGYSSLGDTMTFRAVSVLFGEDEGRRLSSENAHCVIERVAAALANKDSPTISNEEFMPVFEAAWGLGTSEWAQDAIADQWAEADDRDTAAAIEAAPVYSATECQCTPQFVALTKFVESRGLFMPEPPAKLRSLVRSRALGLWSADNAPNYAAGQASAVETDNFMFAVSHDDDGRERFHMNFALGPLFMSMEMTYLHPHESPFEWIELWDERADMFQYLMDLVSESELRAPSGAADLPRRPFIWQFVDAPESGSRTRSLNRIFALDPTGQTLEISPLEFSDGFFGLKERIAEYFGGNVMSNSSALGAPGEAAEQLLPGFGYEVHASIEFDTPDDLPQLLADLSNKLTSLTPDANVDGNELGPNFDMGWNLRPAVVGMPTVIDLASLTPQKSEQRPWSLRFWFGYRSVAGYRETLAQFVPMAQTLPWDLITDRDEGQVWTAEGESVGQWLVLRQS
jgi:hypothetical protein